MPHPEQIQIKDFTYSLPPDRIAMFPLLQRDASKLLVYREGKIFDDQFFNLSNHLPEGASLVLNDTRVIEARIFFQKPSGGVIEIFCLEPYSTSIEEAMQQKHESVWQCMIGGASKWKHGQVLQKKIRIGEQEVLLSARFKGKHEDSFLIAFEWSSPLLGFMEVLHAAGAIPLPPYIKREAESVDSERYQTIFNRYEGSVAAPTSALHFTPEVFNHLLEKKIDISYITLHVGAGTFKPVKSETIAEHQMHGEPFIIRLPVLDHLLSAHTIIAVGTTTLRTLESLHWLSLKLKNNNEASAELDQWEAFELAKAYGNIDYKESLTWLKTWMLKNDLLELHCRTSLLIIPGYEFKIPHALLTNFHQPQSTLLLLVAAFVGEDWKKIYEHALLNDYRFLSYGDSSLLWRKD